MQYTSNSVIEEKFWAPQNLLTRAESIRKRVAREAASGRKRARSDTGEKE